MLCIAAVAQAAPLDDTTQREIDHLLNFVKVSECRFFRNGTWHDSAEAADHIQSKYSYVLKRGRIKSTEDFIALAASKSSMSGKAYKVKCGEQEMTSATWLTTELNAYRQHEAH